MEYEITIKKREPYSVKSYNYEGDDGKRYNSEYSVPDGVKLKRVEYETGETKYEETIVYSQKATDLEIYEVIKAVNVSSA